MARKKIFNVTKIGIAREATEMFLSRGYTHTTVKAVSDVLGISTGHVTFYYPTKEHLLAVLVEMLCDFQRRVLERLGEEGESEISSICLELAAMASMCEENAVAKDFYLSAYTSPLCMAIIRRNDAARAREVFDKFCGGREDIWFAGAEILVSGIEYATLMTTGDQVPLEKRIEGALDQILSIYDVPQEARRKRIGHVLAMDYRAIGRRILKEFRKYVQSENELVLLDLLKNKEEKR